VGRTKRPIRLVGASIDDTSRKITPEGLASCGASLLPVNTVLMSSRASIGLAAVNRVPMATNQGFKSLIPKVGLVDHKFLYWWIVTHRATIEGLGRGATFKEISKPVTAAIKIALPPIAEQRRIAAILDKADEVWAKHHVAAETLPTISRAVFLEMFGNPVTNPKGWPLALFDDICPSHLGKMLDQKQQTGLSPRKYLRNANVRWFEFDLSDVASMDISDQESTRYKLNPGDVMICEGGEPGRAAVWQGQIEDCYFQKALHRARLDWTSSIPSTSSTSSGSRPRWRPERLRHLSHHRSPNRREAQAYSGASPTDRRSTSFCGQTEGDQGTGIDRPSAEP